MERRRAVSLVIDYVVAHVFIIGRRQAELDTAVKELGDHTVGVQGDVSKPEDLDRLYAAVSDSGRRVDVLFANAAILEAARIGDITDVQLDYQLGASVILNASNVAARRSDGLGVYAAIKAAIRSFARTWASELRDHKIRVNAVSPGATDTPGIDTVARMLFPGQDAEQQFEDYQRSIVSIGRYGTPEEVASAVLFLASDLSSFTTGADIPVDGGINQI
ncbi:SDR family NAD(P)-dependent oxidoreductase [Mycolicibacterium moriokaense]|nr:SDR family NAD(P)-dependent oxidoreductase [Mycolicibacterium moriokaense]